MGNYSFHVKFRLWDGSTWDSEEDATTFDIQYGGYLSATSLDDDVHLVVLRGDVSNITYVKRTYDTGLWENETLIVGGLTITSAPVISVDDWSEELFIFWTHNNHIFYRRNVAGEWLNTVDWITETSITGNQVLTSSYKEFGTVTRYIGMVYMTNSTYNVKFASLTIYRNVNVTITNMEGCGNWVFAEEQYYDFLAYYTGIDFDTLEIAFSNGEHWINASYDISKQEYWLTSGSDHALLKGGATTTTDSTLGVTFEIYFKNTILDAYNVDIYMRSNKTNGETTGWELREADYFNIYNLGGRSTLEISGDAGRKVGGDVYELYANGADAWVRANVTWRKFQHLHFLTSFVTGGEVSRTVWYGVDFCDPTTEDWIEGWKVSIELDNFDESDDAWAQLNVTWYSSGSDIPVKSEIIVSLWKENAFSTPDGDMDGTTFWVDLWFNKINASSTIGGRVTTHSYGLTKSDPDWWDWWGWWGTGKWKPMHGNNTQSMFFAELEDANDDVISSKQLDMMIVWCNFTSIPIGGNIYIQDYDLFDWTLAKNGMEGINTPIFVEPETPAIPSSGFLAPLLAGFRDIGNAITTAITIANIAYFTTFTKFMDTIAGWLGYPNFFNNLSTWIANGWQYMITSFTLLFLALTDIFNVANTISGQFFTFTSSIVTSWILLWNTFWNVMRDGLNTGFSFTRDLNILMWLQIGAILYPLHLLTLYQLKGWGAIQAEIDFGIGIITFIVDILVTVAMLFINLIVSLIELIPVIE